MELKRFFCKECGKWLGVKDASVSLEGIYPYCPKCKKQVVPSEIQMTRVSNYTSAKCQHR